MSDMSAKTTKAGSISTAGTKPSKQESPKVATLTKDTARNVKAARIEGSSTGRIQ